VNLDTPIGPEELWRDANSCARCRSPTCAVPYDEASGAVTDDHRSFGRPVAGSVIGMAQK
jgi:hypothetical protein